MHSTVPLIFLALLAALFGTLAAFQMKDNNLSALFGAAPGVRGEPLYTFDPRAVARLTITDSAGDRAVFHKQDGRWEMIEPARDRADFRHLEGLVHFARHLRIEEVIPAADITPEACGFRAGRYAMELTDVSGRRTASFTIGRRTAWHHLDPEREQLFETVFVRPAEEDRRDHVYVCSAPEVRRGLLDRGFGILRDHRPFLFNWNYLASVNIRHGTGEVLLSRQSPEGGWRISKPLKVRTDPEAVAELLQSLTRLEAVAVHDPGAVTTLDPESSYLTITLQVFDQNGEIHPNSAVLSVAPPESADATTALARVNTRDAVFELPVAPVGGRPGLSKLAVSINELRSKTLADLNIGALQSVTIDAPHLPRPLVLTLGRQRVDGRPRWMLQYGPQVRPANELAVARLFTAVTRDKVVGFASDAATDLSPFGLDAPSKRIRFDGGGDESLELLFGRSADGKFYAMRQGDASVVQIDGGTYTSVAAQPHDWRDSLLWPFNLVDLVGLRIERQERPPLNLTYNFLDESWTAKQGDDDVTALLNTQRANKFLSYLEELRVARWLGVDAPDAQRALREPVYSLTVLYKRVNDAGDTIGVTPVTLEVARASQSRFNQFFFGRLSGDPEYFVLDLDSAQRLALDLLEAPDGGE